MFSAIQEVLALFFPRRCAACNQAEAIKGDLLCLECLVNLPYIQEVYTPENVFEKHFAGHLPILHGLALFYYQKQGTSQRIIQNFKYQGRLDLARRFVPELAGLIKSSAQFTPVDAVTWVPMHWLKKRQRGYNQSEVLAQILSKELNVPLLDLLTRTTFGRSQTTKDRWGRLSNLRTKYRLSQPAGRWTGQHVLLVDDVLTTGATLETCGQLLINGLGCRISLATLAMGS